MGVGGLVRRAKKDYIAAMNAPKHPLDQTPEELEASLARAREDIKAGRGVPHEKVAEWLKTWGTPEFKPMPREWLE